LTLAAGFACEGSKPVVAIYSTFLQRAYDQLIHDIAIQDLDVTFAIDRAGLVGPDGATHAGSFDLSYLRCVPNLVIMAPADENECRQMLYTAFLHAGPAAVRYPRGQGPGVEVVEHMEALPLGKGEVVRRGRRIALLAFGDPLTSAIEAGDTLDATVVNMRYVKPIDTALIEDLAAGHELLVTLEDNVVMGGAGSSVNEHLVGLENRPRVLNMGLPDRFLNHGSRGELLADCGLDAAGIVSRVTAVLDQPIAARPAVG
jgi:1-deoxy-D-xylulose-5-phosphate synthase